MGVELPRLMEGVGIEFAFAWSRNDVEVWDEGCIIICIF